MKILSPLRGIGKNQPHITQEFGLTPFALQYSYGQWYGTPRPHNGLDFRARTPIEIFAPFDGVVKYKDSGNHGYGRHLKIRNKLGYECVLAHLSSVNLNLRTGLNEVKAGELIGHTGHTGYGTAAHLHFGIRKLKVNVMTPIFKWYVENYDTRLYGYINPKNIITYWSGFSYRTEHKPKTKRQRIMDFLKKLSKMNNKSKIYSKLALKLRKSLRALA